MVFIAIFFPVILILLFKIIFHIDFRKYVELSEHSYFLNRKNGFFPKKSFYKKLKLYSFSLFIGTIFGFVQFIFFQLFSEIPSNSLFHYRFTNFIVYHFIPGFLIGICSLGYLRFYYAFKKGRQYFRKFLLQLDSGMTEYRIYFGFLKFVTITFVVLSIISNYLIYNAYITVDKNKILYSRIFSF